MHKSRHTVGILSKHPLSPGYHFLFLKSCFIKSVFLEPLLKGMMMIKHFILKHDQMEIYVKKKCKGKNKRVDGKRKPRHNPAVHQNHESRVRTPQNTGPRKNYIHKRPVCKYCLDVNHISLSTL